MSVETFCEWANVDFISKIQEKLQPFQDKMKLSVSVDQKLIVSENNI
jgi:hypothetical protein